MITRFLSESAPSHTYKSGITLMKLGKITQRQKFEEPYQIT